MAEEKKPAAKAKAAAKKPGPANLQERMEGVQGWMAEIEKKQERTTRIGGVAVLLALLAAGGALALGIMNKNDAATQDDIDELTEKVNALGSSVEKQTEQQLKSISQRMTALEQQVSSVNQRQRQQESQITALQDSQAAAAADAAAANADTGSGSKEKANP